VIFISIHWVIVCVGLLWRTYEMHPGLPLKSGCDRSGIRWMLTVGRNQDRTRQNLYLLTITLILSILFLILSHLLVVLLWLLLPFSSRKIERISHLGILYLWILEEIGDLWQKKYWYLSAWMFVLVIIAWFSSLIEWNSIVGHPSMYHHRVMY
jgi:hypothetical protein